LVNFISPNKMLTTKCRSNLPVNRHYKQNSKIEISITDFANVQRDFSDYIILM